MADQSEETTFAILNSLERIISSPNLPIHISTALKAVVAYITANMTVRKSAEKYIKLLENDNYILRDEIEHFKKLAQEK